jgi:hypothetical protein
MTITSLPLEKSVRNVHGGGRITEKAIRRIVGRATKSLSSESPIANARESHTVSINVRGHPTSSQKVPVKQIGMKDHFVNSRRRNSLLTQNRTAPSRRPFKKPSKLSHFAGARNSLNVDYGEEKQS